MLLTGLRLEICTRVGSLPNGLSEHDMFNEVNTLWNSKGLCLQLFPNNKLAANNVEHYFVVIFTQKNIRYYWHCIINTVKKAIYIVLASVCC